MRSGLWSWLGGVLVLSSVVAGLAQEQQHRPNGFYLISPLSLSSGYDDNFVTNTRTLDDTVSILTAPTFSWIKSSHRTSFSADYEPEFEILARRRT